MAYKSSLTYGPLQSISSGDISATYAALGDPLAQQASIVKIVNDSNQTVTVSVDGVTSHDYLPENSYVLYDLTTNHPLASNGSFFPKGTQFYVKGTSGSGSVVLVYLYIPIQTYS